ncbi:C40 family peptidase [Fundidesulfovibrio putealis]|uniref:C40 family peptidase n=1 Tax=Fundidesulfovibrio putealis TaxID=270496 RepID=UPI000684C5FA|nr:C40 family peptidase [Fundidesulfovibrio putealis]
MAVDVSAHLSAQSAASAAESGFHPRLRPRSTRVRAFEDTLAETLASTPTGSGGDAGTSAPYAAKAQASRFHEVRGQILLTTQADSRTSGNEVRGRIILPADDAVKPPDQAPEAAPQPVSSPASGPAPGPAAKPAQFTPEEESLLHVAARVSAPARRSASAKTPSRGDSPPAQAAVAAQVSQPGQTGQTGDLESLIKTASAQLGKRYSFGGESPRQGFDCSGLSSYVYSRNGLDLPRSSREQYSQGAPVERDKLRKGDLVFFGRKGVNHVGIYLDDGKFIHAASSGGAVKVGDLDDPLWNKLYAGARRVL